MMDQSHEHRCTECDANEWCDTEECPERGRKLCDQCQSLEQPSLDPPFPSSLECPTCHQRVPMGRGLRGEPQR